LVIRNTQLSQLNAKVRFTHPPAPAAPPRRAVEAVHRDQAQQEGSAGAPFSCELVRRPPRNARIRRSSPENKLQGGEDQDSWLLAVLRIST